MSIFKNPVTSKNILLVSGDLMAVVAAVYGGAYLRFFSSQNFELLKAYDPMLPRAITVAVVIVIVCYFMDLYMGDQRDGRKEIFLKIVLGAFISTFALGTLYYFLPSIYLGRGIFFLSICITVLLQSTWHIVYDYFQKLPAGARKVLILGTGPVAETMGKLIERKDNNLTLAGYISSPGEPHTVPDKYIIGASDNILTISMKERIQKIVVSLSERRGIFPLREMLDCKLKGIDIVEGPPFYEQLTGKLLIENMNPSHLIFSEDFRISVTGNFSKRLFDIVFASIGIILSIPFLIIVPVLIKLDSKGPVFFRQTRVGEGEKNFKVNKFRTMVEDAEKHTGPVWSQSGDNRITRVGRILRKTRIDEIPQLFNVLRGEMSFIGPRPERPFFVESLKKQIPYYSERHCIKPGVSGWAQVRYEYGDSIEDAIEKLKYDLYYIKYQSISLDLLIVLDTIKVMLFGRGGR